MERLDVIFKSIAGGVGFVISAMVGGLGLAFTVLVGMMLLDIITGILAGTKNEGASSSAGTRGLIKKIYILLLIGAVYLLQTVVEIAEFAGDGIAIAFIAIEFISIVENGGKLGVPLPDKIKNIIQVLKGEDK